MSDPAVPTTTAPRIVVGIDGTERGLEALALARLLAVASGATLVVAAVHGLDLRGDPEVGMTPILRENAERRLDALEESPSGAGWERRVIGAGSPAHGLHDLAVDEAASLVVVGSSHRGALGRVLPGSVGERLLHGSPCPVAVAPRGYEPPSPGEAGTVGAAFDERPESLAALAEAARWTRALGARLRAITVVEAADPGHPELELHSYQTRPRHAHDLREAALANALAVHAAGLGDEVRVLEGAPLDHLAEQSRELDLLVVGSRGYGPLRRVLLGGVSGALLQTAACPVVVVPRGARER